MVSGTDGLDREGLRALVREALRDALPDLVAGLSVPAGAPRWVTVRDDEDLARFVAEVVRLADDPEEGPALREGHLRFRLAAVADRLVPVDPPDQAAERRIERGPVTERQVRAAERDGVRLVLGPAAVLTPLARDRARSSGVEIVQERRGQV
jgi:hypothetical protein